MNKMTNLREYSIIDKRKCTGCGACLNICPVEAIIMSEDNDGFSYPQIEPSKCCNCHLCEKICPLHNETFLERQKPFNNLYYSGQLKDKKLLSKVSSGGAAWGLALSVLENNGIVYGVTQKNVDIVYHIRLDDKNLIDLISRSKYLQSDTGLCYRSAKKDIENGRFVLFIGTGCQIAGLKAFLGKEYKNLVTVDVICHGIPSKKVWSAYRKWIEERYGSEIINLVFRDKSLGWQNNHYRITLKNGREIKEKSTENPFHRGYLMGLYSRPSCGDCHFNFLPRVSDITVADYWQYDGIRFCESLSLGVSLICVNSEKGKDIIDILKKHVEIEETTEIKALESARHLNNKPQENVMRNVFLQEFNGENFYFLWKKYIRQKEAGCVRKIFRRIKRFSHELYNKRRYR